MRPARSTLIALLVTAMLVLTGCGWGGGADQAGPPTPTPPTMLFVGDSYAAAGYAGVTPQEAFPCRAASTLGYTCLLDVRGATGYAETGRAFWAGNLSYLERLPATRQAYPVADVIVVSGGRNDDLTAIGAASLTYLTALREAYPQSRLVVLEPFWIGPVPDAIFWARAAVKTSAATVGATWLPTADWMAPSDLGPDLVHPTLSGQNAIVRALVPALRGVVARQPGT